MRQAELARAVRSVWKQPAAWVVVGFELSRVGYYLAGIRFDPGNFPLDYHFIDLPFLKTRLLESLLYLHSQPPLFNALLGLIVKIFPDHYLAAIAVCFSVAGLFLAMALFALMIRLGVKRWLACGLMLLFVVNPTCVLFENQLHYTYPIMLMLVLAALFLHRFVAGNRLRDGVAFFLLVAAICLTMSFFHVIWMAAVILGLWIAHKSGRRQVLMAAAVPLLLVLLWYGKNLVLFRTFSASSWFGMNFSREARNFVSQDELDRLVQRGTISDLIQIGPFHPLEEYRDHLGPPKITGIPVLDQEMKAGGWPNLNNIGYIQISREFLRDDLELLKTHPQAYLLSLGDALIMYFIPSSAFRYVRGNAERIMPLVLFSEAVMQGRFRFSIDPQLQFSDTRRFYTQRLLNMGLFIVLAYGIGLYFIGRQLRTGGDLPVRETLAFIGLTLVYVLVVGTTGEVGENPRFRLMVDPLLLAVLGAFITGVAARRRRAGNAKMAGVGTRNAV